VWLSVARLLLVEDDMSVRVGLSRALSRMGHAVDVVATGAAALERVTASPPELVVLDLGLPDIDGWEVLRMLRGAFTVPVVVETARDDDTDVVRTLNAGADDYVVKPFTAQQLGARINAVLRRVGDDPPAGPVRVGGLEIDARAREVRLHGQALELTTREFDLLWYLAERVGVVVPKAELLAEVWRQPTGGSDKTVDVHLSWLRRKLGESAQQPVYLHTVRRAGVRLAAPE
jgi:DNA-binding response OmpR family regulator